MNVYDRIRARTSQATRDKVKSQMELLAQEHERSNLPNSVEPDFIHELLVQVRLKPINSSIFKLFASK